MLKITSGMYRGRRIQAPPGEKTRPTQERLRQAWMNSLQMELPDAKVLELFAGSGALGFEALSRGAASVVFIEKHRTACQVIQRNAKELAVESQVRVLCSELHDSGGFSPADAARLKAMGAPFDLVLADPPYAEGWEFTLLEKLPWTELLQPTGVFCLEWNPKLLRLPRGVEQPELPEKISGLQKVREKNYGETVLTHYRLLLEDGGSDEIQREET